MTRTSTKTKHLAKVAFILSLVLLLAANTSFHKNSGLKTVAPMGAYLNGAFPDEAPTNGSGSFSYTIENAFPNLTFTDPLDLEELPNGKMMLIGKPGYVWLFDNNPNTNQKTLILDLSNHTKLSGDSGMLGLVLHPEFGVNGSTKEGYFYVWYRYVPQQGIHGQSAYMRLSRFTLAPGASTVNPNSEFVLIQQYDRHDWHNGGDMFFGPDGFLYISVGDEGGANDQYNSSQKINDGLFGGVLRIDVDQRGGNISHPIRRQPQNPANPPNGWPNSRTQGYYIPNDNPWQDTNGGILEEFYAIGLRSPHRMTYDVVTGDIWFGDVGQGSREELSVVHKGDNMQWPYKEGSINGPKSQPTDLIGNDTPPVFDYPRSFGNCVIGGFVCRSSQYPELLGKYLFADHEVQNIWTIERDPGGGAPTVTFLLNVPVEGQGGKDGISSFALGKDGTIYILDLFGTGLDGGKIHKLKREVTGSIPDPPAKLSDLNVFKDMNTLEVEDGIIPYTVNAPLWSDRAAKKRWIALPHDGHFNSPEEKITFYREENWRFPPGTVMIKHFDLPTNEQDPTEMTKLETRFVIFDKQGSAYGVTYRWNDEGTEAFLINEAETRDINVTLANGSTISQTWDFPSRQQCMTCHNVVAGYALGIKTRQINGELTYPSTGILANQLDTWNALGIFHEDIGAAIDYPRSVDIWNPQASRELRVRSYWDANCAFCHRPNGVDAIFDARGKTPLYEQMMINAAVISHSSPVNGIVITPQQPLQSVLWTRNNSVGSDAMPPLAKNIVDDEYMALLTDWINQLPTVDPIETPNGWFFIQARHSNQVLGTEVGKTHHLADIQQANAQQLNEQKWFFQHIGDGKYRITNSNSGHVLAVEDFRTSNGSPIVQQYWTGMTNQLWYLHQNTEGFVSLTNVFSGLNLGIKEASQLEGTKAFTQTPDPSGWQQQFSLIPTSATQLPCITYLSDLNWNGTPQNGWGPPEKDRTNGGQAAGDGNPITINGKTYTKGIGAHANSEIIYSLNSQYQTFYADIGVDDGTCTSASIQFEVVLDGVTSYQSPIMGQADDAIPIQLNVRGVSEMRLIIRDGGNGITCDHGDWADARLESCTNESCNNETLVAIPKCFYQLYDFDSEEVNRNGYAIYAFDENPGTIWHTEWYNQDPLHPHYMDIDFGQSFEVAGLKYLPRQDGSLNGTIGDYEVYLSEDGMDWGFAVAKGSWPANNSEKEVTFKAHTARYARLVALNEVNGNEWTSAAEIQWLSQPCLEDLQSIGEAGIAQVTDSWTIVLLDQIYLDPVIVAGSPTQNATDQAAVSIRNVTGNSFEMRVEEYNCLDGNHQSETVPFIVLEAGTHQLQDGTTIMAGHHDQVNTNWSTISYPAQFETPPLIFAQPTTNLNGQALVSRIDHTQSNNAAFNVSLQSVGSIPNNEQISWIAVEQTTYKGELPFESGQTSRNVDDNWYAIDFDQCYSDPVFISQLASFYEGDLAGLRIQNLTGNRVEVFVEEDNCADTEIGHTTEDIHFMVFPQPGPIFGQSNTIIHAKVFLQGPWNGEDMNTTLNTSAVLPQFQPYQNSQWNYNGTECVTITPLDAVDWVLVQIRHPDDMNKVVEERACLLRKDGVLIDLDGKPGVNFGKIDYASGYISIQHRNHLGVMSQDAIPFDQ